MGSEWRKVKLEDAPLEIIDGDRGINYPKQSELLPNGYCLFLNAGNVTAQGFDFSNIVFISKEKDRLLRKGKLVRNDVVLTTRGTVGNSAYFDDSIPFDHIRINSGMVIFRAKQTELDPRYLYFFIRSKLFYSQVEALRTGSAQPQLPIRDINKIIIPLPPLPEQRAIAHILGTLDDKIELNRRMNQTLEEMARALFKSWFVDFDPVRAKAAVRREHPDWSNAQVSRTACPNLKPEIAELFPDEFENSELGEIPKGWRIGCVDDVFDLVLGQSPPGETYNEVGEGIPFYQGRADFTFRFPDRRVYCTAPTRFAKKGDTLISVRAPVGAINLAFEDCAIGRGVAAARHKTGAKSYTYYFMHGLAEVFNRFEAEGTVFGSISKKDFHAIQCVIVPSQVVEAFERLCEPIDVRVEFAEIESRSLAALRDTLLPKLISGEIRVKDAEKFLKERGL